MNSTSNKPPHRPALFMKIVASGILLLAGFWLGWNFKNATSENFDSTAAPPDQNFQSGSRHSGRKEADHSHPLASHTRQSIGSTNSSAAHDPSISNSFPQDINQLLNSASASSIHSENQGVAFLNEASGEIIQSYSYEGLPIHAAFVLERPDAATEKIAAVFHEYSGTIKLTIFNLTNSTVINEFRIPGERVAFNETGSRLAVAIGTTLDLWDVSQGIVTNQLQGQAGDISIAAFVNSHALITGSFRGVIQHMNLKTGEIRMFAAHSQVLHTLGGSRDHHFLVSGGNDDVVKVWNKKHGSFLYSIQDFETHEHSILMLPDRPEALVSGKWKEQESIYRIDLPNQQVTQAVEGRVQGEKLFDITADGVHLLSAQGLRSNHYELRIHNIQHSTIVASMVFKHRIQHAVFSPDEDYVLVCSDRLQLVQMSRKSGVTPVRR